MGETQEEVREALQDIAATGCEIVTMGQYLQPTKQHLPVDRWLHPDEFAGYAEFGRSIGLAHVEAGPLVRSSYRAGRQYAAALAHAGKGVGGGAGL